MLRKAFFLTTAILGLAMTTSAGASADMSPTPTWKLIHRDLSGSDNMALIGPGNDTRVNLIWFFSDRAGGAKAQGSGPYVKSLFDYWALREMLYPRAKSEDGYDYSGSRCDTNKGGSAAFKAAVEADKRVPAAEQALLISTRDAIEPNCESASGATETLPGQITSAAGKGFAIYLSGTNAFYGGDYASARSSFAMLSGADNAWVKETAAYMLGRVELNRAAAIAFGEWGEFEVEKVDKSAASAAGKALGAYLSAYPKGRYATSAKGLMRRVHWLSGDSDALASEYAALADAPGSINHADLAEEVDLKLLPWLTTNTAADPILLATLDLKRMRSPDSLYGDGLIGSPLTLDELQAQRPRFASNTALFEFLVATHHFHVGGKPQEVLKLIPDAAKNTNFSYLDFSRQMLRGLALEATGDRNARGFWLEMIDGAKQPMQRQAIELAIGMHDERAGQLGKVFDAQSQVRDPAVREILLTQIAGPDLLRVQSKDSRASKRERDVALYTLLYKSLTRGAYRDFVSDVKAVPAGASTEGSYWGIDYWGASNPEELAAVPLGQFTSGEVSDDYPCPSLTETVTTLSVNAKQPKALLCVSDFLRLNGFDQYWMDWKREPDELGGTKTLFPGKQITRQAIYQQLIADPSVGGEDKAYALFRAVWCYGPSGNNSCDTEDVPVATRKGWHDRLKRDYPNSKWAKSLKYYW